LETRAQIAGDWLITLDPELISYSLLDAAVMRIPDFEHQLGYLLATAARDTADIRLDRAEERDMIAGLTTVQNSWEGIVADFSSVAGAGAAGAASAAKYSASQAKVAAALKYLTVQLDEGALTTVQITLKQADLNAQWKSLQAAVEELHGVVQDLAVATVALRHAQLTKSRNLVLMAVSIAVLLGIVLSVLVIRMLSGSMRGAIQVFERIAAGDFTSAIPTTGKDETGLVLARLADMQSKLKQQIESDRAKAGEVARVKQALDHVCANVSLTDPNGKIVYINHSMERLFKDCEPDFRRALPQFSASKILGSSVDMFHEHPDQQRRRIAGLDGSQRDSLEIGGRQMTVISTPVKNEIGERLGTVAEWVDRTQEILAEREVEALIGAAVAGRLTERIPLGGKSGFLEKLAKGCNDLLAVNEGVIADVQRVFSALARGEITQTIEADYQGIYATLKQDANATVAKLVEVVQQIQLTSDLVSAGSLELSHGNENLSRRTEEQASSLEETAASMEQMTNAVKENADNSAEANQLAAAARVLAQKGGEVLCRAVTAMSEINASSRRIAAITNVIDEIAFQTNLLALNAAVEAARAGEQGRGFAVVASEVRNLAGRSATAAKEIKSLIEDSVAKVVDGSRLVDESGKTLEEIVAGVKKVTDLLGEITAGSHEQSVGIDHINKAVMQMDEMTQQNASLVEEACAANQVLTEQAQSLTQLMSFFDLGAQAAPAAKAGRVATRTRVTGTVA
jgi:methyl-accepting chemotaxis protein